MANIMVVDDDTTVARVVETYLRSAAHEPVLVDNGSAVMSIVAQKRPDLMILDVMLPGVSGLQLCAQLRRDYPTLPIIMLTALSDAEDRIAGLVVGADDYVTKPFSPRELVLRVDSVLRRAHPTQPLPRVDDTDRATLQAGPLTVDLNSHRVTRDGTEIVLTSRELELLAFLLRNPGKAFSREELMREVWGWTFGDHSTVTVHVRRLREKIESDPVHPTLIRTVWGVGYRLELP